MSNIYNEYFSDKDFFDGLSKVMYDIRSSKISKQELVELSDELVKRGQIPVTSRFEKRKWWGWSKKYVNYLMNGMSTGSISKEYLLFYARVSRSVKFRNTVCKIVGVIIGLIMVGLMIKSLVNG